MADTGERGTWSGREGVPHPDLSLLSMDDSTQAATLLGDGREGGRDYDELPERIGRYLVLDELGAGAMGVVYAAYDPDLDRKLALKLLHDDEHSADRTLRLLREAQALARVSHPNVIQVYDVGTFDERVYIAMEFIDGLVLGEWLTATTRTTGEILRAFVEAGRGLAAAHDKGLVHRDFKPDNVLVARDGRVVVLDFGIAHAVATVDELDERDELIRSRLLEHSQSHSLVVETNRRADPSESESSSRVLDTELTRVGALIGTPAYMAPEQLEGAVTNERSDQFSFCVALWQAIHGERPYAGDSPLSLWQAMQNGRIAAPSKARVPGKVQRALRRGLAIAPGRRFADMHGLLAVLDHDPQVRRRRVGVGVVLAAAIGVAALGYARPEPVVEPVCQGAQARLAGVWDAPRRAALVAAYEGSPLPLAQQVLPSLLTKLDAYAGAWQTMYTDACEATHLHREQSEELLDLRMRCLDERKLALDTLVAVLLEPDATIVENSYAAATELRAIDRCADQTALVARVAPPEDPTLAQTVTEVERDISEAQALRYAGIHDRALDRAQAATSRAKATGYAPIEALALIELGDNMIEGGAYEDARATLHAGFYRALAAGDDEAAADAATSLVLVYGDRLRVLEDAQQWAAIADAILTRHGDRDLRARVELQYLLGVVLWRAEELERARAEHEKTLALAAGLGDDQRLLELRVLKALGATLWSLGKAELAAKQFQTVVDTLALELGATHPRVASALNNLASAHYSLGKLELAEAEFLRAIDIVQRSLGEDHPSLATSLNNLAVVYTKRGKLEQARDAHLRVLAINEKALGPDHAQLANSWTNLARVCVRMHEYEAAADYYQRAYQRCRESLGDEHSETLTALAGLGRTDLRLGRIDEGLAKFEQIRSIRVRVLGPDHPDIAELSHDYGEILAELGEHERGTAMLRDALGARERILGADHPDLAQSIASLAHARLEAGDRREAAQLLERFFAIEAQAEPAALTRARARHDLAQLRVASNPETAARAAREGLALLADVQGPDARALRRALERAVLNP